jgi:lipopolysaccharide/colanic/teichoic acid biosynthesis glycosyltransferase
MPAGKRIFDVAVSAAGIVLGAPLWLAVSVLVKLDSSGPVLHRSTRVGRGGRPFRLLKFRSMVVDAAAIGPGITRAGDPRITRVGALLRRTKLDEAPQFVNVLKGDMSIVGPRPEDPGYVAHYTPEQRRLLEVRPGMVSAAGLRYPHEERALADLGEDFERRYVAELMPEKLRIELDYVSANRPGRDLALLWSTLRALLTHGS